MKNTKKVLTELLENSEWNFNYHSKEQDKANAMATVTEDNEELKETHEKYLNRSKEHYKDVIKYIERSEVLKDLLKGMD